MTRQESAPLVLVADDSAEAQAIGSAIGSAGYAISLEQTADGGAELFAAKRPSLVVIGVELPGALELCDRIRAMPRGGAVPIVLLGGPDAPVRSAADAILRGADAYFHRPIDAVRLVTKIETFLGPMRGDFGGDDDDFREGGDESQEIDAEVETDASERPPETGFEHDTGNDEIFPVDREEELEAPQSTAHPVVATDELERIVTVPRGDPPRRPSDPDLFPRREPTQILPEPSGPSPALPVLAPLEPTADDSPDREPTHVLPTRQPAHGAPMVRREFASALFEPDEGQRSARQSQEDPGATPAATDTWDDAEPVRPERTQVLPDGPTHDLAAPPDDRPDFDEDEVLGPDFRRVIDEVAQRLFPESPRDPDDDDSFDDLRTFVPVDLDAQVPLDDDLDAFGLDAMETFPGVTGLTVSAFDTMAFDGRGDSQANEPTQSRIAPGPHAASEQTDEDIALPAPGRVEVPAEVAMAEAPEPTPIVRIGRRSVCSGTLDQHPFPVVFASCIGSALTGRLVVEHGEGQRGIVFVRGRPGSAASTLGGDRLVEMLHRHGRLTGDQLEQCRSLVESSGRRPGAILVEHGLVTPEELFPLVRWHYEEIIYSCFSLRTGAFRVEPIPAGRRDRVLVDRGGAEILLEGLRRRYEADELERLLGGPQVFPRGCAQPGTARPEGLLEEELPLLRLCDGLTPLDEVVVESGVPRGQALAVVYGLVLLGQVEVPQGRELPRLGTDVHEFAVDRGRLEQRIRLVREADYFAILGLSPDATGYEVRLAYRRARRELSPEQVVAAGAADLEAQLVPVRTVVEEAYEVLRDDALRRAYRESRFE